MGDDDLLIEMIDLIRDHNEQENWKKVAAEAHKLKPNLSYMGLKKAREIIVNVEKTAKNDPDQMEIEHSIDRVETICRQAYQELEQELTALKT